MKRSEINAAIRWAEQLLKNHCIALPPFANWSPSDFAKQKEQGKTDRIVSTMLGWDVTDFGSDDFAHTGAVLFTLRNGNLKEAVGTPYAEKVILMKDGSEQEIPMHYHIEKTEDIINRGGGILCLQLCTCGKDGKPDMTAPVTVRTDGIARTVSPAEIVELMPGESITLTPYVYHRFYAKTGAGDLVVGEVSKVNDDHTDNVFAAPADRFCATEEDEAPYRLLVADYQ